VSFCQVRNLATDCRIASDNYTPAGSRRRRPTPLTVGQSPRVLRSTQESYSTPASAMPRNSNLARSTRNLEAACIGAAFVSAFFRIPTSLITTTATRSPTLECTWPGASSQTLCHSFIYRPTLVHKTLCVLEVVRQALPGGRRNLKAILKGFAAYRRRPLIGRQTPIGPRLDKRRPPRGRFLAGWNADHEIDARNPTTTSRET